MRPLHPPTSMTRCAPRSYRCLWLAALSWLGAHAGAEGPAPADPALHLTNGGFVTGELRDSAQPGVLNWQGASFAEPFAFGVDAVNAIHWPSPVALTQPAGDYSFELSGGDV